MNYYPCYDDLLAHLLTFMPMPAQFKDLLYPCLTDPVTYLADTLVLRPGDVADMAYWPVKGYARAYTEYKPEEDREMLKQKTIDISTPGKIALPVHSFMNQTAAEYYLEMAKGSTIVGFSYTSFIELGKEMPEVFMLANKIIGAREKDWLTKMEMCKVAHPQGYEAFLDHFDSLVELFIFQMHIASYIGVSAEWLSKIRKTVGFNGNIRLY